MKELGRNDPCWCGSNKKYKKCHMQTDQTSTQPKQHPAGRIMEKWKKTSPEIEKMQVAGAFNGQLMDYIRTYIKAGISTEELDELIKNFTISNGHIPACINYRGYPKASCISINEVVCHGIPSKDIIIKEGDIVNVDVTTIVNGYHGDQSETFLIGNVTKEASDIVKEAANSMVKAINIVKPGESFAQIGEIIEKYATSKGYSVVSDFTGHGIGSKFHEDPPIYHFKNSETRPFLMSEGMTFTIEPMINAGTWRVEIDKKDKWTVRTSDKKLSAQFEHTILVTKTGFEVLTLTPSQKASGIISFHSNLPENNINKSK